MTASPITERKASLRIKACQRCAGDLFLREDEFGARLWTCLQCGRAEQPAVRVTTRRTAA